MILLLYLSSKELERVSRDYKLLQQNQQISIARAKEEMRDSKNKEISALKNKMEQVKTSAQLGLGKNAMKVVADMYN